MAKIKEETLRLNLEINGDDTRKRMGELREELNKTKQTLTDLKSERKHAIEQYGKESEQVKALTQKINDLKTSQEKSKQEFKSLESSLKTNQMTMRELASKARELKIQLNNMVPGSKDFNRLQQELKETNDRMKQLKGQADTTGKSMQGMIGGLKTAYLGVAGAIYGVVRVFSGAVNTMKDFEQANVNLSTILGVTTSQMEGLTREALRLGGSTRYTATQVTQLQTELAKLGFNQSQIKAMEEPVLNFATAVGAELPEAAALAGAALRMFGLNSTDADDTLAALAISTNKSALNFGFLQSAMSTVGPVAKTFGFGIKDTVALLGALANAGFDASSAATATRNILLKLADSNGDLAKSLGGPVKTFDELIAGLDKLSESGIDLAGALELTDRRSVAAFTSFLAGADATKELRDELELTEGALDDLAKQRMNTLEGSILSLQSAWERFILSLRGSTGVLKQITDGLTLLVQGITDVVTGGDVRHENSVNALLEDLRFAFKTDAEAAAQLNKEMGALQKKADDAKERLANASTRKERKQIEKEVKDLEERISRGRDALERLNVDTDESGGKTGNKSGNGGAGGGSDDDDKKNKKTWSLNSDKVYLQQKAELTRQFNAGEIKSEEEYLEALYQAEQSAYKARLALHKETGADRAKIEADMQASTLKHTKDVQKRNEDTAKKEEAERRKAIREMEEVQRMEQAAMKAYIAASENREERTKAQEDAEEVRYRNELARYEARKDKFQDYAKIVEALELQHQNNLRQIRLREYEAESRENEAYHNERIAQIKAQYAYEENLATTSSAKKLKLSREAAKAIAAENLAYLQAQASQLQTMVSSGRAGGKVTDPKLSEEQLQKYRQKLQELLEQIGIAKAEVDNLEGNLWGSIVAGTGDGSLFGISQSDWELFFQNLADGTMSVEDLQTAIRAIGNVAQEAFNLTSKYIELTNAKEQKEFDDWSKQQDEKKDKLKSRLDSGLMTQAQYDAEIERMEKDRQAKEDEMKLTQAERQKKLSIVQAIINTALGVTQTLAQWGLPWGLIPAAAMAAMGAAEIAMISAQPVGFAKGGKVKVKRSQDGKEYKATADPDKRGYVDKPTILVGEEGGEYVIPAEGVKNPSLAPVISQIENARRMGTLKSLSLEATYPAAAFARGGYTVSGPGTEYTGTSSTQDTDEGPAGGGMSGAETSAIMSALNTIIRKMDNPIPAIMSMTGKDGFEEVYAKRQEQRSRGKIG
ncbi:MAG: phage tail tape measure protein [Bacteroidales bacterium]|nr:phage tail tape measure protein [Bacteroidales bacterium]